MTDGASTSTAVVTTIRGQVANVDAAAIRKRIEEIKAEALSDRAALEKQEPVREGDGVSIPGILNRVAANNPVPGMVQSYNALFTVKSLKNIKGSKIGSDPAGKFILIPLHLAELRSLNKQFGSLALAYPKSRITGSVIMHVAIVSDSTLCVFSDHAPDDSFRASAYATGVTANISIMPIRKQTEANAEEIRVLDLIRNEASKLPSTSSSAVVVVAASARSAFMTHGRDDDSDEDDGTILSWYVPTGYGGRWYPPEDIVRAYLDRTSTRMTDLQRRSLELEYPDIALNSARVPPGHRICVNYDCGMFIPISAEEYVGQGREDFMSLVLEDQIVESHWQFILSRLAVRRRFGDIDPDDSVADEGAQDDAIVITSRNQVDNDATLGMRLMDMDGKATSTVYVTYDFKKTTNFVKFIKKKNRNALCLAFNATGDVWESKKYYFTEASAGRVYKLMARGIAWETVVAAATGITPDPPVKNPNDDDIKKKLEDWVALAKIIFPNATVAFVCRVDERNTTTMPANLSGPTGNKVYVSLSVDNMIIDMPNLLRKHAIPVTAAKVADIMSESFRRNVYVPNAGIINSAVTKGIGSSVCLTELANEDKFAAAIAAKCSFYVLCEREVSPATISKMTPEIGDAVFDASWSGEAPITLPSGAKIEAQDPIRQATAMINRSTTKFVWAVRGDIGASIGRAGETMKVLANGGRYDKHGFPLIDKPIAPKVLAIKDSAPVPTPAPAPAPAPAPVPAPAPQDHPRTPRQKAQPSPVPKADDSEDDYAVGSTSKRKDPPPGGEKRIPKKTKK